FIFINAAFPPLHGGSPLFDCRFSRLREYVGPCLHETAESSFGSLAIRRDVYDILQLHVIQQETIYGAVLFPGEILTEIVDIQAADAFVFAYVNAAVEMRLAI